jgi:hypothetical protein
MRERETGPPSENLIRGGDGAEYALRRQQQNPDVAVV